MSNENSLNLLSRRGVLGFMALAFALPAASVPLHAKVLTLYGTVSYRERVTLPTHAILQVSLVDVALADAPEGTIALTAARTRGRLPISYRLRFDDRRLRPGRTYGLKARILVDGKVWFTTTTPITVHGPVQPEILVLRAANEAAPAEPTPIGKWLAESIRSSGVIDNLQSTIEIAADGKVAGKGGCNSFGGKAAIEGDKIGFGSLAATQMACPPAIMDQETKFLAALNDAKRWMIDDQRGKLILFDGANKEILLLARM
jgi:putative lipoprotein